MKVASQTLDRMVYLREFWWPGWMTRRPWGAVVFYFHYHCTIDCHVLTMFLQENNDGTVVGSCLDAQFVGEQNTSMLQLQGSSSVVPTISLNDLTSPASSS